MAVDCGEQPGEVSLALDAGTTLDLFWDWPFGASSAVIEEASSTAPDTWVPALSGVVLADDFAVWESSFGTGTLVRARIRREGSDASCSVVSDYVELG